MGGKGVRNRLHSFEGFEISVIVENPPSGIGLIEHMVNATSCGGTMRAPHN
jgi:hypothetical protein